jgi:uncharacterized membrane protein
MLDRQQTSSWSAQQLVKRLLQGGLATSVILLATGLTWSVFSHAPSSPVRLGEILESGGPDRVMTLGVLTLALTPLGRVVALILLWWRERDYPFVAVGLVVIGILGIAIVVGHA